MLAIRVCCVRRSAVGVTQQNTCNTYYTQYTLACDCVNDRCAYVIYALSMRAECKQIADERSVSASLCTVHTHTHTQVFACSDRLVSVHTGTAIL